MIKCKKCVHYYRMMAKDSAGYNPAPCCHLYEDKGKRPNILTQECFSARKTKSEKKKEEKKVSNMKNINNVFAMEDSIAKMKKLCSLQLEVEYMSPAWQTVTGEINRMQSIGGWFDKYLESILK